MTNKTPLAKTIEDYEKSSGLKFVPTPKFYEMVKINKIRFAQIVKGHKLPLSNELVSLAEYFKIQVTELL